MKIYKIQKTKLAGYFLRKFAGTWLVIAILNPLILEMNSSVKSTVFDNDTVGWFFTKTTKNRP